MHDPIQEMASHEPETLKARKRQGDSRRKPGLLISGASIPSWLVNLAVTVLRLVTGVGLAMLHGWQKLPPSTELVAALEGRGMPLAYVLALIVGLLEVAAGICLALGLMTRLAGSVITLLMTSFIVVWHAADSLAMMEPALSYLVAGFFFFLVGGGRLSLDAFLRQTKSRPSPTAGAEEDSLG